MAEPSAFDVALQQARKSLKEAYEERAALEQRIVSLKQTIDGLASLCDPEPRVEIRRRDPETGFDIQSSFSLSFAIRQIFSDSQEYMLTPTEVRDALLKLGLNLAEKYKQPLVPIHNTLKRLEAQGELVAFRDDTGDLRGYRWVSPLARAVAEIDSNHPIHKLKMRQVNPGSSSRLEQLLRLHETPIDQDALPPEIRAGLYGPQTKAVSTPPSGTKDGKKK
jgi:hypothetical protein